MKDPVRLRDSASGASNGARELLERAQKTRRMTDVERARIVARGAKMAAMPVGGLLASPILAGAGKLVAGVVVAVVGAKALPALFASDTNPRHETAAAIAQVVPAEAPPAVVVPAGVAFVVERHAPEVLVSVRVPPAAISKPVVRQAKPIAPAPVETARVADRLPEPAPEPAPEAEPEGDELTREARHLSESARLLSTNLQQAMEKLAAHQTAFPRGKLGMEREVLVLDALVRAGRTAEARAHGEALLVRAKGSFHEARVRRMLEKLNP